MAAATTHLTQRFSGGHTPPSPGREFMAYDGMLIAEEQREVVQNWDKRVSTATRSKKNPKEDGAAHEPLASETMCIQERPAAGCFF